MSDGKGISVLMVVLIAGNAFTAVLGLALFALAIWVTVEPYGLYPLAAVTGKDDIFAGSWIAIFTGFAFFCIGILGMCAAARKRRGMILLYLLLILIAFMFECASAISAATHRDYLVGNSNVLKKQMLEYYSDDSDAGRRVTLTWNRVMQEVQCCGADGPLDWLVYNSTFRHNFGSSWPLNCCTRQSNYEVAQPDLCAMGYGGAMFTTGCFSYMESVFSSYTWAISCSSSCSWPWSTTSSFDVMGPAGSLLLWREINQSVFM